MAIRAEAHLLGFKFVFLFFYLFLEFPETMSDKICRSYTKRLFVRVYHENELYFLVRYCFKLRQSGFTNQKLIQCFSSGEVNIFVRINGIYVLLTFIIPTTIRNSLYQICEAKQRIFESENHFMKNHLCSWPIRSCLNEGGDQQTGREP